MRFRTLGSTGLSVSVVGVGTWQFGGEWGPPPAQSQVDAIFEAARECGINLIDTAECYGDHLSESLIGEAIRRDRERWIIATKFGHRFHAPFERDILFEPGEVLKQLENSLRALKTDYVDVYQSHSAADAVFRTEGLWEMLAGEKAKGRIRHLGISVANNENLAQADQAAEVGAEVIQIVYNRLDRKPENRVFPSCARQNLGVLARVPLASGFLSGKYKPGASFPADDVREKRGIKGREQELAEVQRIQETEVPPGMEMAQWALAWCLKNPTVTAVIPGCRSAAQVRSNAAGADLNLS